MSLACSVPVKLLGCPSAFNVNPEFGATETSQPTFWLAAHGKACPGQSGHENNH